MTRVYSQAQLPKNFAQQLLSCEIQVQLNEVVPKEIIMEILQLYSKGMEYFQSIRSYKYMYFQRKMNSVMRSPKIINSMTTHNSPKDGSSKKQPAPGDKTNLGEQDKMKIISVKQKYEKMYNDLVGETSSLTGDKIRKIVAENQLKINEVKETIKDQISEQERRLQLKIQRRKFQKATKKSMSVTQLEKSTRDSLFNEGEPIQGQDLDTDFSKVINEHQYDSDNENPNSPKKKFIQGTDNVLVDSQQKVQQSQTPSQTQSVLQNNQN